MEGTAEHSAAASAGGEKMKKALFALVLGALLAGGAFAFYYRAGAGADGNQLTERYLVGRLATAGQDPAASNLIVQSAAGGGETAVQAMRTCVEMQEMIAAVGGDNRGALAKTMQDIAKGAEQLPIGLERVARSKPPQPQAHYKEMLLRYFGRNCAAIAELFQGERAIGR